MLKCVKVGEKCFIGEGLTPAKSGVKKVNTLSIGVNSTLKVGLVPMETTGSGVSNQLKVCKRAVRLLLVKYYNKKMVYVTLQLGHLSVNSALGG